MACGKKLCHVVSENGVNTWGRGVVVQNGVCRERVGGVWLTGLGGLG